MHGKNVGGTRAAIQVIIYCPGCCKRISHFILEASQEDHKLYKTTAEGVNIYEKIIKVNSMLLQE